MAGHRRALLVCCAVSIAVSLGAQDQPVRIPQPYRSSVEIITITATVRDADGRLVTGLPKEAFDVFEDGDLQDVTQFTRERVPVSLGLLLDVSDSMYGQRLQEARAAVERFLFELLDRSDECFVLAFNHEPRFLTPWTSSAEVLRSRLAALHASGGTAVYDAVLAALPMMQTRTRQRAALVIISDGADTASDAHLRDVESGLLRTDLFAYAIAIDNPDVRIINTRVNPWALREITDDSGGRTEVVHDSSELVAATSRIAEELNNQYLLGYRSSRAPDGQYHSIRVKVRGGDYRVRARRGYMAGPVGKKS